MKILEVADRTPDLINQLLEVWKKSVRATHLFLSDREIKNKEPKTRAADR